MTEKLFYRDSMIKNFQAEVLSCSPLSEENDINTGINYEVVLDRTPFSPRGEDSMRIPVYCVCRIQRSEFWM